MLIRAQRSPIVRGTGERSEAKSKSERGLVSEALVSFPSLGLPCTRNDILSSTRFFSDGHLNKSSEVQVEYVIAGKCMAVIKSAVRHWL